MTIGRYESIISRSYSALEGVCEPERFLALVRDHRLKTMVVGRSSR